MILPTGKNILILPHITTSIENTLPISDCPVWVFSIIGVMFLILSATMIYLTYVMCKDCLESKLAKIFTIVFAVPVCSLCLITGFICFKQVL